MLRERKVQDQSLQSNRYLTYCERAWSRCSFAPGHGRAPRRMRPYRLGGELRPSPRWRLGGRQSDEHHKAQGRSHQGNGTVTQAVQAAGQRLGLLRHGNLLRVRPVATMPNQAAMCRDGNHKPADAPEAPQEPAPAAFEPAEGSCVSVACSLWDKLALRVSARGFVPAPQLCRSRLLEFRIC